MPEVLVLCEYASLNGGERSLLSVIDGIREEGFDILVAAPPAGPLAGRLAERDIRLIPLALHDQTSCRLPPEECRGRIRAAIARSRPDLVHANSLSMSRLSGPVSAGLHVPSIGHLRDIIKLNAPAIADLNRHCRLLAVSRATHDWYVAAGLDGEKTHVVYNGVDLRRFCPRPATGFLHRELGLPSGVPLVGAIGQIGMRKGLHVLAAAASHVAEQVPDVHFVVVGKRYSQKQEALDYETELIRAASMQPLAGRFHFLGLRGDVPFLLNEFTILAHAARQEPLGRVLLEAAASGTPVVATNVGGTQEIFPDSSAAAELVPVDDPQSLCAAITRLLEDYQMRRRMGKLARCRAEEAFDARAAASKLVAQYNQALGAK